ncbi:MAG: hypothetical protein U9P36_10925 [Thermodesulfobacteriota bacterium]|nr:hypothetical protein [Thermodesulfobacteriota bacterium]
MGQAISGVQTMRYHRFRQVTDWVKEHDRLTALIKDNPKLFTEEKEQFFCCCDDASKFYAKRQSLLKRVPCKIRILVQDQGMREILPEAYN